MAPDKTVDIGSFSIASKVDKDFALNVSTSMSLSLPEHFADHLTAKALRDQVIAGELWLTRAGSCRLILAIHFEHPAELSVHGDAQRRQLAIEAFQSLPVWRDLGLELHLELNVLQSNRSPSATSVYYIQHTQQHSGLFVPRDIPCGYLSEISCSFRYAARSYRAIGGAEEPVPRPRNQTRYNLRKLAGTRSEPRSMNTVKFWGLPPNVQAERLVHLTHNALNLMLGMRKRCLGIWCLKGTKPPSLLELAPAVWNAQYFRNVVTRAQLIPAISSALGNLMSTQSPLLRRRLASLVPESAAGSGPNKVLDELYRRTQVLLLRSARDQKIRTCLSPAKARSAHDPGLDLSREGSSMPTAPTRNDFTHHAGHDLVQETLHVQEDRFMKSLPDHSLMHLESESSYGFTTYRAGSVESDGLNFAPEEDHTEIEMEYAECVNDDVFPYTSEVLPEYGGLYNEHCVRGQVLDSTYSEQEYQDQHLALDDAHQEHEMEDTAFYNESDHYGHYYGMSDIEGGLQLIAHAFEDHSDESNTATGNLENPGDDYSDLVADEDDDVGDDVCEHLGDDGKYVGDGQNDAWEINVDCDQGVLLHGDDIADAGGPNYITRGHVHHHDQVKAAEGNTRVHMGGQVLQDWSQVPRDYESDGIGEPWTRLGPHLVAFTSRLGSYQ